jgi:hypothetical protein
MTPPPPYRTARQTFGPICQSRPQVEMFVDFPRRGYGAALNLRAFELPSVRSRIEYLARRQ